MSDTATVQQIEKTWPFTFKDRTWQLPRPAVKLVETPYIQSLREIARQAIKDTFQQGGPDYRLQMEILQAGFVTRFFWKSDDFWASLRNARNAKKFLYLWLQQAAGEDMTLAVSVADVEAMWNEKEDELSAILLEMLNDPNLSTPS